MFLTVAAVAVLVKLLPDALTVCDRSLTVLLVLFRIISDVITAILHSFQKLFTLSMNERFNIDGGYIGN